MNIFVGRWPIHRKNRAPTNSNAYWNELHKRVRPAAPFQPYRIDGIMYLADGTPRAKRVAVKLLAAEQRREAHKARNKVAQRG